MATKKNNLFAPDESFVKSLQSVQVGKDVDIVKTPTIYELNGNNKSYNWNEEFVTSVIEKLYAWFTKCDEVFYTSFARTELNITHGSMCKRLQEFPQQWTEMRDELDVITTERLFRLGSTGKIDKELTKLALKHLGTRWNDAVTMKMEVSIEEELERAYKARLAAQAEKGL